MRKLATLALAGALVVPTAAVTQEAQAIPVVRAKTCAPFSFCGGKMITHQAMMDLNYHLKGYRYEEGIVFLGSRPGGGLELRSLSGRYAIEVTAKRGTSNHNRIMQVFKKLRIPTVRVGKTEYVGKFRYDPKHRTINGVKSGGGKLS